MAKKKPTMMDFVRAVIADLGGKGPHKHREKRSRKRYQHLQQTDASLLYSPTREEKIGERFPAYMRNVSRGGVGLLCRTPFRKGEVVGVLLPLTQGAQRIWGKVIRSEEHCSLAGTKMLALNDVGLQFCTDYENHFVEALQKANRETQVRVVELLTDPIDPCAEAVLLQLADVREDELRCEAVFRLGTVGTEKSVEPMLALLRCENLLRLPAHDPLCPLLREAGLVRKPSRLPMEGSRYVVLEVGGGPVVVLIRPQHGAELVAECPDMTRTRVTGTTRKDILTRMEARLIREAEERPAGSDAPVGAYVFVAELAAASLRKITDLDLPLSASAAINTRQAQQQAWNKRARAWLEAQRTAEPAENGGTGAEEEPGS